MLMIDAGVLIGHLTALLFPLRPGQTEHPQGGGFWRESMMGVVWLSARWASGTPAALNFTSQSSGSPCFLCAVLSKAKMLRHKSRNNKEDEQFRHSEQSHKDVDSRDQRL